MKPAHKAQQQSRQVFKAEFYQGIIPQADALRQYEEIVPGLADRIVQLTEAEVIHRRKMEHKIVNYDLLMTLASQACALLSVGGVIWLCYYAFSVGYAKEGAWIAIAVLVSIAGAFLYKRKEKSQRAN